MRFDTTYMAENLKHNLLFPFSAVAFFVLSYSEFAGYGIGIIIAGLIALLVAAGSPDFWKEIKKISKLELAYGALCTAGVCLAGHDSFIYLYRKRPEHLLFVRTGVISEQKASMFGWLLALLSFYFIFIYVCFFIRKITAVLKASSAFNGVTLWESLLYAIIFLITSGFIIYVFSTTDAFYWAKQYYDVIYTSDSPAIFRWNAYMTLTHQQNDLRQPLFFVFSAPFLGVLNLISAPFFITVKAMLLNIGQIAMLIFANYLLARLIGLSACSRAVFVLLFSSTYTYMLFSLMMEQYIVAYFWLMLFLYERFAEKRQDCFALYGTGGTLLTSMVLLPFAAKKSARENILEWIREIICIGIGFVILILAFCRFDVFYSLAETVRSFARFTGTSVPIGERVLQYLAFARNVFLPPAAEIAMTDSGNLTWQLSAVTEIDYTGIAILLLGIISAVINRKKQSTWILVGWWAYSVVIIVLLGWGTAENGLILYSLYFGWALIALMFQLVEEIGDLLHVRFLGTAVIVAFAAYLLVVNYTAVKSMVTFMTIYYPL